MNITVYLGSNYGDDPAFRQCAQQIGTWIAEHGHTLVYGGSDGGMMGVLADHVIDHGGQAVGIIPTFFTYRVHQRLTRTEVVENMSVRKNRMLELGDAFIALPGGLGTIEEISEAMSARKLGIMNKPVLLMNINGYYDGFKRFMDDMVSHGFMTQEDRNTFYFASNIAEMEDYLNTTTYTV